MKSLLLLLLALPLQAQQQDSVFTLPLFKDGLYTRYSANAIPDGALAEALNVTVDEDVDGVVVARRGYSKYNTSALADAKSVRGLWSFDAADGTKYMVAFSSQTFYKTTGDGAWTAITGLNGYSLTKEFDCVQTLGALYCGNGDVVFYWNGTSTAAVSAAPLGNMLGRFRNRLLIAGVSGAKARLRGSGELDTSDWTLQVPGVSTTPFSIPFGGVDDGEDITCLMGAFQDVFIVGKRNSLWGLYGFGRTDFQVRELSREVGCLEHRSVREKNNCLYWMSLRGVEKFCGASIERIGDPIRNNIDTIVAAAGNARSATDTSQPDFESGNTTASGPGAPVSTTITPASIVPSTFSHVDTSTADFSAGTLTYASTQNVSGGELAADEAIENSGFEDGNLNSWTTSGGFGASSNYNCRGTYGASSVSCLPSAAYDLTVQIVTADLATVLYSNRITAAQGCTNYTFDASTQTVSMRFRATDNTSGATTYSVAFSTHFIPTGIIPYSMEAAAGGAFCIGFNSAHHVSFDLPDPFYAPNSTFTSAYFDTGFSTPTWGTIAISSNIPSGTSVNVYTSVSTSATGVFDSRVAVTNGGRILSAQKRVIRYEVISTTNDSLITPTVSDVTLNAATTAYFISQCRQTTGVTNWGLFTCNVTNTGGGTLSFAVSTGTSCNQVTRTTATWTDQANNTTISVATAPFIAYRPLFDFSSATSTFSSQLAILDCSFNWTEGSARPPVASQVYRDRYYLAYTSSTATGSSNDHLLVLDRNDKWTVFDNHPCYSMAFYNRKLYCGSATDVGRVWLLDNGTDDDGTAISSIIRTKAFHFGMPERRKSYSRLYLDLEPSPDPTQTITLSALYTLERSTPTYSLGNIDLNEDPGSIMTPRIPFPLSNPVTGRYLQLGLESHGLNSPWRLFSGRLYFSPLDPE